MTRHGSNVYKQTAVTTASKGQLLVMLYEAAIRNVKKAIESTEKKDMVAKGLAIGKAHDIINELLNTLNFQVGGKIAEDLERLYNFMVEKLVEANMSNATEPLKTTEKLLVNLLDAWKVAVEEVNKSSPK